ncbi:phage tail tape measure protein [Clostridium sporogenes]|uniref:phage tail tape measure protein n=1 Tax=Clostridium sporogenes TaxID=1509 RepID=UPI0013D19485|nr:phage tail tape measure protein [Clostridium sporogenes]MBA4507949.1 phage tail tape measure protein [Clostridium sporogenes]NFE80235.1 phage tail tape measure protein [Clostridium sporogenes]NFG68741.1 phage tail tape measure protein [Clostridium sporogenes]
MADGRIIIDTEVNSSGAEKGISQLSKKAQDGLGTMNKAFLATSAAIGGIGAYAIKVGGDFEEGMSKVQAISGATGEEIKLLSEKAKEMGAKTKFSATESAEAMQYMAMA